MKKRLLWISATASRLKLTLYVASIIFRVHLSNASGDNRPNNPIFLEKETVSVGTIFKCSCPKESSSALNFVLKSSWEESSKTSPTTCSG